LVNLRREALGGIPIVENKILAQILFRTVEVGEVIPPELYQAVAEILPMYTDCKDTIRKILIK